MSRAIEVGRVETPVHGRYLVCASDAYGGAPLLVAFHGYGESAESMLESVVEIPGINRWHLASIQGLSRFYRRRTGEVVASWMTKQDREVAIADNLRYVSRALEAVRSRLEVRGPIVLLGFSQGTAMAYRAATVVGEACAAIVALAGDVPPELASVDGWARPQVLIGRGTEDDWYNESKNESDVRLLEQLGSPVETCVYDGGHQWTNAFRRRVGAFLDQLPRR